MSSVESRAGVYQVDVGAMLAPAFRHWLRILLLTLLAVAIAYGMLMFVPKTYEASAHLIVQPAGGQATAASDIELLISSQTALARSRDVLEAVIDSENLREVAEFSGDDPSIVTTALGLIGIRPAQTTLDETVLANLRQRLTVSGSRDTGEMAITVASTDPGRAAELANAIARESVRQRAAGAQSDATAATSWLQQEITRLRQKVTDAESAIASFRADNDLYDGRNATPVTSEDVSTISAQIADAQQRKNDAQARADLIRGLIAKGQPLDGVSDVRNSVVIQGLLTTLASLRTELAQKSTTLLANHPTIRALKAQIGEIQDQVSAEGKRVAAALDAEAQVESDLEGKLRDSLVQAKAAASTASKGSVTLADLQRDLKAQQDLLASDLAKYAAATSTSGVNQDVRITEEAAAPSEPASPKVPFILGMVAFIVLALQIAAALLNDLRYDRSERAWRETEETDEQEAEAEETEAENELEAEQSEEDDGDYETSDVEDDEFTAEEQVAALAELEKAEEAEDAEDTGPWMTDADLGQDEWNEVATEAARNVAAMESDEDDTFAVAPARDTGIGESVRRPSAAPGLDALAGILAREWPRVILLACVADYNDGIAAAARLVAEASAAGRSVIVVDAGSGAVSLDPGISDLSMGRAEFGQVVQRVADDHSLVPWGRLAAIDRRSSRPATLVTALSDIYKLVVVNTGKIGLGSTLPLFVDTNATVVVVSDSISGRETNAKAARDVEALGLKANHLVAVPNIRYRVA